MSGDADYLRDVIASRDQPVLLVGHSYAGFVITAAAADNPAVLGLVYVSAFAPDTGESALELSTRHPGSTLGDSLTSYPLSTGGTELAIRFERFHAQFAADVSLPVAGKMAHTQRPVTERALSEAFTVETPAWKRLPSWFVFGAQDRNIPAAELRAEAERAGARSVHEVTAASHALPVSRPDVVARTIFKALAGVSQANAA